MKKKFLALAALLYFFSLYTAEERREKIHPLLLAAKSLDVERVEKILKEDPHCDINMRDQDGMTPLFLVVKPPYFGKEEGSEEQQRNQVSLICLLKKRGALVDIENAHGETLASCASQPKQNHVLNALEDDQPQALVLVKQQSASRLLRLKERREREERKEQH